MGGLREKKKKQAVERILKAARDLFLLEGFEKTTTNRIAEMAEVSVGTLYNHYRTKEDVFLASIFGDSEGRQESDPCRIPEESHKVLPYLVEYCQSFIARLTRYEKALLRELMKAGFNSSQVESSLLTRLIALDRDFMANIASIIAALENAEQAEEAENIQMKTEMVYSILAFEFLNYIYSEDSSMDDMNRKIRAKIHFLWR